MTTTRKTTPKRTNKPVAKKAVARTTTPKPTPSEPMSFAVGQKWAYGIGHAEIVHVGKILIDYRFHTAPNQKRVPITTDIMKQFEQNLKKQKAKLIS